MALCERSHITSISCNHMIVRNLRRPPKLIKCGGKDEGTGTRSNYLVNRGDEKNKGPLFTTIARQSRNSRRVSSGGVGVHGQLTQSAN